jgi:hypothetical protein
MAKQLMDLIQNSIGENIGCFRMTAGKAQLITDTPAAVGQLLETSPVTLTAGN